MQMQYEKWLNEWLENYVKPSVKLRTYARYSITVEKHLSPKLGRYEMDELTGIFLQRYVTELLKNGNQRTGRGLSVNTVSGIITVVKTTLKLACTLGLCKEYVGDKIKRPKAEEKKVDCFTQGEQKRIEKAVGLDKRPKMFGVVLCLYTGLRIGELLALTWTDIDFKKGVLSVNKTCFDGKNEQGKLCRLQNAPKTLSSKREIPIPKQLLFALRELKKNSKSKQVIEDKNGKLVSVRSYQRSFELLLKKIGFSQKCFHSLRHTFATRALECGMDVKTLSELLGHKSPTVTLNRYAHSMTKHKREMMNKLGKLYQ